MGLFYSFSLVLYAQLIRIAALFNPKAKAWVLGRKNWRQQLKKVTFQTKNIHWFHCASLGEFDMAAPLMEALKSKDPSVFILVTFFSPSGMEHYTKRKHVVDFAFYLPIDTKKNARDFLRIIQPKSVFLVKYEFWSNFIFEAKKIAIPVFSICTLLRADHRFFKWYGAYFRKTLQAIDFFYTQNEKTTHLLTTIGIDKALTIGDLRFDRVLDTKKNVQNNERIEAFLAGEKALIFGSTWPEDEALLSLFIAENSNRKIIIAPHSIDESHLKAIEKTIPCVRYTAEENNGSNVLLLNTIGHLSSAYRYGEIAYVGGGFSGKLHNILEPAVFGLPVIFGPKFSRFPEASAFIEHGIGFSVDNETQFSATISSIRADLPLISLKTSQFVDANKGAADAIYQDLITRFVF